MSQEWACRRRGRGPFRALPGLPAKGLATGRRARPVFEMLVVVTAPSLDSARTASSTLDWLDRNGPPI
jgi:hypothetical protein